MLTLAVAALVACIVLVLAGVVVVAGPMLAENGPGRRAKVAYAEQATEGVAPVLFPCRRTQKRLSLSGCASVEDVSCRVLRPCIASGY
jgi:hypothetical protein